jgi:SNF2 family DNA or RNA helicase
MDITKTNIRMVTAKDKNFRVRFSYEPSLVDFMRKIPGRYWMPKAKYWNVPATKQSLSYILTLKDFGFSFSERAEKLLDNGAVEYSGIIGIKTKRVKRYFVLKYLFSNEILNDIKTIDGRKWDKNLRCWFFPVNAFVAKKLLWLKEKYNFKIHESAEKELNLKKDVTISDKLEENLKSLNGELRNFQKKGVAFVAEKKKVILGDQMGLGKTIQAIGAVHYLNSFPALIVCPASVKLNWEKEIKKWTNKKITIIEGQKNNKLEKADFYIINYDILSHNKKLLKTNGFKSIILDESQFCKNPKSARTKAAMEIAKKVNIRILLTGTPVRNRPAELISQLRIVERLDDFGGWFSFINKYCDAFQDEWGWNIKGASNTEELNKLLRATCYIRRTKDEVMPELPEKVRSYVPVKIDNEQDYLCEKENLLDWYKENKRQRKLFSGEVLTKIERLKQFAARGKIEMATNWINEFLESDDNEKLVVFAHHRIIVNEIFSRFKDVAVRLQGGMSSKDKQNSIDQFQNNKDVRIIVVSITAGGIGINLTAANKALFIEQAWTPVDHDQAEDRLHRIGQKDSVNCYYLIGIGTIDETIANIIANKRKVVDGVTEGTVTENAVQILEEFLKEHKTGGGE